MATSDYSVDLKATLDTTDVDKKLAGIEQVGLKSFQGIENAVKRLDGTIQKLEKSMSQVQKQSAKGGMFSQSNDAALLKRGMGMASSYLGGKVLAGYADQYAAEGNVNAAVGFRAGQGALQGAAMGMMFGPAGMVIGAAAGALDAAFKQLADSAQKAADKLKSEIVEMNRYRATWRDSQTSVRQQQTLRGIKDEPVEQLKARIEASKAARDAYESFVNGEAGAKWMEENKDKFDVTTNDFFIAREKERRRLEGEMKEAGIYGTEAEKILKGRQKTPNLSQFLSPTSDLARSGRDVGGYGGFRSIEQQQLAQQIYQTNATKEVASQTKASHDVQVNLYSLLMRMYQEQSSKGNTASWGK